MFKRGLKYLLKYLRIALHWLARVGLILLFSVFGLLFYLQTPAGRQGLGDLVARELSAPNARITIAATRGVPPRSLRFEGITIADSKGVWARIGSVDLVVNPLALFERTLSIEALRMQQVEVLRQPEPNPESKPFRIPDLPVAVRIAAFATRGLKLHEAVAGVPADMTIRGTGLLKGRQLLFDLDVKRTDAATDQIIATFKLVEDPLTQKPALSAHLNLRGDPGGVFAGLAGLKPGMGVTASLQGEGPLNGWDGDLAAKAGGLAALQGHIKVRERPGDVQVGFTGEADVAPIMPKDVSSQAGSKVALDGDVYVARGRPLGFRLKAGNAALVVTVSSPGDPAAKARLVTFEGKILNPAILKRWTAPAILKAATFRGVVEGGFKPSRLQFEAQIDSLSLPQVALQQVKASGDLKLARTAAGWSGSGVMKGRLSGLALGNAESGAIGFDKVDFSLDSGIDAARQVLTIARLDLRDGSVTASGAGQLSLKGGESSLRLQVNAADLAHFEKLAGLALKGGVVIDLALDRKTSASVVQISGKARSHGLELGHEVADNLLGPEVEVAFDGTGDAARGFQGKANIKGRMIAAEVNGGLNRGVVDGTKFNVVVTDSPALADLVGMPLPPSIRLDGTMQGKLADLSVEGRLVSDDLVRKRLKLTGIHGQFAFRNLGRSPQGSANFHMKLPAGDLNASARLASLGGGGLRIDGVTVTAPETEVKGNLSIVPGRPLEGRFTAKSTDLKKLAKQFDLEADGRAEASLTLKNEGGRQRIDMAADGLKVGSVLPNRDVIRMDKLTFAASGFYDGALHDLNLELAISGVRAATAEITSLTLKAKGEGSTAHYTLALEGNFRGQVSLASTGDFIDQADGFNVTVNTLGGKVYDRLVKLNKPFYLVSRPGQLTGAPLDLTFGEGRLAGSWREEHGGLVLEGAAQNLDLILFSLFYPEAPVNGQADATARITVVEGLPAGEISFSLRGVTSAQQRSGGAAPIGAILDAKIAGKAMTFTGKITEPGKLEVGLSGSLPLKVNPLHQTVSLAMDEPLQAEVNWKGEVATLWNMMPPGDHRISGNLDGRVTVTGSLADPAFHGAAKVSNGAYDSLSLGLVARELEAALTLEGRRVTVVSATASDASGGTFKAKGWVDLRPSQKYPAALDLVLDKARIIRTSDLKAAASAVLAYSRAADHADLSGSSEVRQIEGKLIRRLPVEVPEIEVTEINLPPSETGGVTTRIIGVKKKAPYPTTLNIHLKAARRIFVRGRGLDSEWKGDLDIEGTYEKPVISGDMSLVSGTFTLAGKDFTLTEGTLAFTAGEKVDPLINVRAEYKMTDLTAILVLSGPASKPLIKLTSTPELPQEEVMSRILFGTSVAQLGPLEAVQLGSSVASLSGSGGGLDLVNFARTTLGLDRLRVQSSADKSAGALIAGGKYLTNNIYLEVETATGTGQSKARVKVNLTQNLSAESDVGSANSSGIAIKWQKDY